MVGRIPELSVARGSIQFTSAENRPRSAYATNGLDGHVAPNVGGRMSVQFIGVPLHCPDCKHVVVTFPATLAYPLWHPNTQLDPYVFPQETLSRIALGGIFTGPQL